MADDILKVFIEESYEHLAEIEDGLMALEHSDEHIDQELINKIYRAAHSIKGGAGFVDLTTIRALTHEMENAFGKMRSGELTPEHAIVEALLSATDTLKTLLADTQNSNNVDVSVTIEELRKAANSSPSRYEATKPETGMTCEDEIQKNTDSFNENDVKKTLNSPPWPRKKGENLYRVHADIIGDLEAKGRKFSDFIRDALSVGKIVQGTLDIETVDRTSAENNAGEISAPFRFIYATILEFMDINKVFNLDPSRIALLEDGSLHEPPTGAPPTVPGEKPDISEHSPFGEETPTTRLSPLSAVDRPNSGETAQDRGSIAAGKSTVRVQVNLLETLMNLAGELVLGRNQLLQAISSQNARRIELSGQRMDRITTSLQETIMLTRMQPVGIVFNKFPRLIRDLSRKLGKTIELRIEGKEVELDKTIIEAINDPLTHLVRNAIDHGIEPPEERKQKGKPESGLIVLKAFHAAGQINIEVQDDGRGLSGERIADSALAKGIITEQQSHEMSIREKMKLIFLPGFSTATEISEVSGRGVGMDVVKTNIEKIGGHVLIDSSPGNGTIIQIKLPLTLAIIPCQIVVVTEERFAIPQANLLELIRITPDKLKEKIEIIGNAQLLRLRNELLPLVRLADLLGMERTYYHQDEGDLAADRRLQIADRRSRRIQNGAPESLPDEEALEEMSATAPNRQMDDRRFHAASSMNIAVVTGIKMKYGLIVDKLLDAEEIVVKPLGRHLKEYKGYAGATIMGDGRVALILDVVGLAHMAELNFAETNQRTPESTPLTSVITTDRQSLLIFRSSADEQFAVPLGIVRRIEKIKREQIEHIGNRRIIQYNGGSLPLFSLDETAQVKPIPNSAADLLVIVYLMGNREIGLLATGPVDAVDAQTNFDDMLLKQPGIMGSAIIAGQTTLLVDLYALTHSLAPEWFSQQQPVNTVGGFSPTILYAEDSRFFRTQVKSFMEDEGYKVIEAQDGVMAWELLQKHKEEISLVVTDIEMPNLDGYGLAQKIKTSLAFKHIPVIALTTLAGEEDLQRGKALGIDDYNIKLDRDNLLKSIRGQLEKIR
jgi:two-component system chemotaxis sensor kinase CheA